MTNIQLIQHVAEQSVELMHEITSRPNACILGTRLFVERARDHGILCRPVPIDISVFNASAAAQLEAGTPDTSSWPPEAYSVGVHGSSPADALTDKHGGYSWHLIAEAVVPGEPFSVLVDISSEQFSRPAHDIIVASPLVVPVPVDWKQRALDGNGITFGGPGGEVIWLKPAAVDAESGSIPGQRPGDYRKAVDWIN